MKEDLKTFTKAVNIAFKNGWKPGFLKSFVKVLKEDIFWMDAKLADEAFIVFGKYLPFDHGFAQYFWHFTKYNRFKNDLDCWKEFHLPLMVQKENPYDYIAEYCFNKKENVVGFNLEKYLDALKGGVEQEHFESVSSQILKKRIMTTYNKEYLMNYYLDDITYSSKDDSYVFKWNKRFLQLTNEEYNKQF